jgi:hypothetical protein
VSKASISTLQEIALRRIANQLVCTPRSRSPEEIVRWMGAIQGQDYRASLLAIALRSPTGTTADVIEAFANRKLVRSWPMRGTLHVLPAEDAGWIVGLLGGRGIQAARTRRAQLGLDPETTERAMRVFRRVLSDCQTQTRPQLYEALRQAGIDPEGQRGIHLIGHAAQSALVVGVGAEGKQPSFALLEDWVSAPTRLATDEAWSELALRYVQSHGPVTERDFAWWSGSNLTLARSAFASHETKLERLSVDNDTYFMTNSGCEVGARPEHVFLLPGFDELYLGYANRDAMLRRDFQELIVPGRNGVFQPFVIANGEVVGTWRGGSSSGSDPVVTLFDHAPHPNPDQLNAARARIRAALRMSPPSR